MSKRTYRQLTPMDFLYIVLGSFITALSIALFSNPARLAPGGVSGIATLLFHTFGWDPGVSMLALSVPLFIAGVSLFGSQYGIKSLIGSVLLSFFTTALCSLFGYEGILDYTKDMSVWLSALYGGVLSGFGIGIVMKSGANTGGTDIAAQILARYSPCTLGTSLFLIDGLIIFISAFVFSIESALYAIVLSFVSSLMLNKVVLSMGTNYAKTVYIVSNKLDAIGAFIIEDLNRGGTILDAKGLFSNESRPMLMTVIPNRCLARLTRVVEKEDPSAFMVIQETHHVLGEGYTSLEKIVRQGSNDYSQM